MSGIFGKPGKPIMSAIGGPQAKREVDETPTPEQAQTEGMQIKLGPATQEKAPYSQHDPMFATFRMQALAIGSITPMRVPNIARYYIVRSNPETAAGGVCRVQAGSFDITLAANQWVKFPGRTDLVILTVAVAICDITVVALGDDDLRF